MKENNKNSNEKTLKSREVIENALSESFENTQPTDEFRQTLLKSGLDVAAFHALDTKPSQISADKSIKIGAVDSAKSRNEFLEAGLIRNSGELSGKDEEKSERFGRWQHLTAIAGILAIIVLQSAFQFFFIQDENERVAENVIKNDIAVDANSEKTLNDEPTSEAITPDLSRETKIETKGEYKKPSAKISIPLKRNVTEFRREPKIILPRTAFRKKEMRESNTERLRRAEKILTGI